MVALPARRSRRGRSRLAAAGCAGLGAGALLAGLLAGAGLPPTAIGNANDRPSLDPALLIDAAHLPPLLTRDGDPAELRYDVYCAPPDGAPSGAPCDAGGTVFVRAGDRGAFEPIPLVVDTRTLEGRLVAPLPRHVFGSASGFSYYAVVENRATGTRMTIPAGGAAGPQRSRPLGEPVEIDLGVHEFGAARRQSARVFHAPWGSGPSSVGLEGGRGTQPIGPSAFDVEAGGVVTLLDQVNRRALRFGGGSAAPAIVPLAVNGTIADLAVDGPRRLWVLETAGARAPLLRAFSATGRHELAVPLAERTAAQVRIGPRGPMVKQYPSEHWFPALAQGQALDPPGQATRGEPAQPLADGGSVLVFRTGQELRLGLVGSNGVTRSWRVRSATSLGEVQLAERLGNRLLVVVRAYSEQADEFVVLLLGAQGVAERFAVESADWSETAPLSRFRLAGSALYQLGSTPAGVHVDRFALEVT